MVVRRDDRRGRHRSKVTVSNVTKDFPAIWRSVCSPSNCYARLRGIAITVGILSSAVALSSADAHIAPSGWAYPYQCCSDRDCQPVHGEISEGPDGYVVKDTGEIIGYQDPRLRYSPDGEFHLCAVPGKSKSNAICLFVPPRSF